MTDEVTVNDDGQEVWRLTAGTWAELQRQTASELDYFGPVGDWLEGKGKPRRVLTGHAAQAAVTRALGGFRPPSIIVRETEVPSGQLVIREVDPDDFAIVQAIVRRSGPIEATAFTMLGWNLASERGRGRRLAGEPRADLMPRSTLRPFPELRELVRRGEFR